MARRLLLKGILFFQGDRRQDGSAMCTRQAWVSSRASDARGVPARTAPARLCWKGCFCGIPQAMKEQEWIALAWDPAAHLHQLCLTAPGSSPAAWDFSQHSTCTELFEVHGLSCGFWT